MRNPVSTRLSRLAVAIAVVMALPAAPALAGPGDIADDDLVYLGRTAFKFHYSLFAKAPGRKARALVSVKVIGRPAISPDGRRVAFTGYSGAGDNGRYSLYVVDFDGTGLVKLTDPAGMDRDPAWSPNSKTIVFSRDVSGGLEPATCCRLKKISADGGPVTDIPNTLGAINPDWSPGGGTIAFEKPGGIYTINPNGSSLVKVADTGSREPAWSQTGRQLAFVRATVSDGSEDELVVLNLGTGAESVHYDQGNRVEAPQWIGSDILIVVYNGYGYDGRSGSRVIAVRSGTKNVTVLNPQKEIVLAAGRQLPCIGFNPGTGIPTVLTQGSAGDCMAASSASGDFDNDGFDDLAVGIPGDGGGGSVHVYYGTATGIETDGVDTFYQGFDGMLGGSQVNDRFGESLTSGDFDNDGFDDLAVGIPGEGTNPDVGAIAVIYGNNTGLTSAGNRRFSQGGSGIKGSGQADDRFGESLTSGDFDNDGFDDLAVGIPGEGTNPDVAAIAVIYGNNTGLTSAGNRRFSQGGSGIKGSGQADDRFGESLTSGDFDNDGFDDLAVGIPGEGTNPDVGAIAVIYGNNTGLTSAGNRRFSQGGSGIKGSGQADDRFGESLTSGDFDNDGFDDLAVGIPGEGTNPDVGAIAVIYGNNTGLTSAGNRRFSQGGSGIKGSGQADDRFGESLTSGDFDNDGFDDLAVGIPGEGTNPDVGAIAVIYGNNTGLTSAGNRRFSQGGSGIKGSGQADDRFGESLTSGDFDNDGFDDLAVGIPGEGTNPDVGAIAVIYGNNTGLTSAGNRRFSQE